MTYIPSKFDIGPVRRKFPSENKSPNRHLYSQSLGRRKSPKQFRFEPLFSFTFFAAISASLVYSLAFVTQTREESQQILGAATAAYADLSQASASLQSQKFEEASVLFKSAQENLLLAQEKLDQYRYASLVSAQTRSANNVLLGAYLLSEAGRSITSALQLFDDLSVDSQGVRTGDFTKKLSENFELLLSAKNMLDQAQAKLELSSDLPADYQNAIGNASQSIRRLSSMLENLTNLEDLYLSFFGGQNKTYLLVFQNNDEVRATGGFIGTYGVVKIDNGEIKRLVIDSIYDLDGRITKRIAAPGPFQPVIAEWGARDANWFSDFSLSSQKLLYFLEQGQETADGVIALTPKLFTDLLALVGPISMEQYGVILTEANFQDVVQYKTSYDYDKQKNEPKKFLSDFAPIVLNRLADLKSDRWFAFFQILSDNLMSKQILLFSKDEATQSKISKLNFGGLIQDADGDYLAVINSNMGGTKTDLEIAQTADLTTKIYGDGTIINYLKIARNNTSNEDNRDYLRVLVPRGSELLSVDGVDPGLHLKSYAEGLAYDNDLAAWDEGELKWERVFVRTESGKTAFSAWLTTPASASREVLFVYRLPFKVKTNFLRPTSSYSLLIQKQSGSLPYEFHQRLDSEALVPIWTTANAVIGSDVEFNSAVSRDDYWAVILAHE
ncbi:MAG: DUF4012 domain-containing protein [Candidatus Doudnabacteria bacterium]|nr:DUF4012 domain-containing protein [Candidatus Doudnabacteria bacterium]